MLQNAVVDVPALLSMALYVWEASVADQAGLLHALSPVLGVKGRGLDQLSLNGGGR